MSTSSPLDGDTSVRVRRGRVESVDLYEIKDMELDQFENGTPGDLQLNFAIFLISLAFSAISALATATFANPTVENTFLFVAIIGVIGGLYFVISWWRSRSTIKGLCQRIRQRIPPDQVASTPADSQAEPEPDPDEPVAPVG